MRDYGPDRSALNYGDYFVRGGADQASVAVQIDAPEGVKATATIVIDRDLRILKQEDRGFPSDKFSARHDPEFFVSAMSSLIGAVAEPLFLERLIYLHSYRKVVEGMPDFGDFIRSDRRRRLLALRRGEQAGFSAMKTAVLAAMIGQSDLFEAIETGRPHPADTLEILNSLLERFAGGQVSKLKAERGSKIDIRVSPKNDVPSYSFDGLSSSQKEIISTLFMIWQQTYRRPSIVLIDEPELHLNAEWHKVLVEELHRVALDNQCILATHSEHVAESVPSHRRAIMRNVDKAK
jgi:predicted ATPase